jgi:hypothetical protein
LAASSAAEEETMNSPLRRVSIFNQNGHRSLARRSRASRWRILVSLSLSILLLVLAVVSASGQSYSFSLDQETVDVYLQSDGTMSLLYRMVFTNDPSAPAIEFVDLGMPSPAYDLSSIAASIDNIGISHIANSEYIDQGIELGLGSNSIQPGRSGTVVVQIANVRDILYEDTQGDNYASVEFYPNYFDSNLVHGRTDLTLRFHLPPGVQPDEPRWHDAPGGWPDSSPATYLDNDQRVVYEWHNPSASASTEYKFGASFPQSYVPPEAIVTPGRISFNNDALFSLCCFGGVFGAIALFVGIGIYSSRRRKLDYLPPKISIEGHGIKRGLTAIEAAVLLETPLDRVLTMVLFSTIKKGAAKVVTEDPLKVERLESTAELRDYEKEFLEAMIDKPENKRRSALQDVMINIVKSVQKKMKGFSLRETRDYYKAIMKKAWEQIEQAETPEVKSERYAEGLEWTMLDRDFDDRTKRVFRSGPVYLPPWWWYYRPSTTVARPATISSGPSGGGRTTIQMPTLPGSEFAASLVTGVQNTASKLVSNVVGFTNGVTKTTNPPPPPSKSSGWSGGGKSGGCACACACACAGCACACAGGGR